MTTAFQSTAFQTNAFQITAGPVPVVVVDTHDDGKRKRSWDAERRKREERRNDLIAAYELLVEGNPQAARAAVEAFVTPQAAYTPSPPPRAAVDWSGVLDRVEAADRLWAAFLDLDDDDILVLM